MGGAVAFLEALEGDGGHDLHLCLGDLDDGQQAVGAHGDRFGVDDIEAELRLAAIGKAQDDQAMRAVDDAGGIAAAPLAGHSRR